MKPTAQFGTLSVSDRTSNYVSRVKAALPHIRAARAAGLTNAREFADYLNTHGIPAPTRAAWSEDAVLRALHRSWMLRLDDGSRPSGQARKIWHRGPSAARNLPPGTH